jgi:hypothetical protein
MPENTRDEPTSEQVTRVLQEAILRNYPNPDRTGCRGSAVLREMAEQRLPHEHPFWLQHVHRCSPCYREFLDIRNAIIDRQTRKRSQSRIAIAAALALVLVGSVYFALREQPQQVQPPIANGVTPDQPSPAPPQPTLPEPAPQATVPKQPPETPILTAVLNLESESSTRDLPQGAPGVGGELQRVPRGRLTLVIYLPLGSEAGAYEVRLLKNESDSASLAMFTGTAQIENGLTALRITPDLSKFGPGAYVLAIRRGVASWRYYRFALS